MKKFFLFLCLLFAAFCIGFQATRWNPFRDQKGVADLLFGNSFRPTDFPIENRLFTVVVIGYNNGAYVQKTLESIFAQTYENFRLVYVDDGSNDGSYDLACDLL